LTSTPPEKILMCFTLGSMFRLRRQC